MNRVIKTTIIGCLFLAFFSREILDSIQAILFKISSVGFNWSAIPLFILTFVLLLIVHKDKKKPLPTKCSGWGVLLLGISIIAYLYIYLLMNNQFLCTIAWIFVMLGSILLLFGWNIVRITWISFVLLFFLIPLPYRPIYHQSTLTIWHVLPYGFAASYFLILWLIRNLFIEDSGPENPLKCQQPPETRISSAANNDQPKPQPGRNIIFFYDISFLSAVFLFIVMISLRFIGSHALNHPLQKSLQALDESKITPYIVIENNKITNEDVLESLGTKEYLMWKLDDTEALPDSPVRYCSLFITYYSLEYRGYTPVYTPEETYIGGGKVLVLKEPATLKIPGNLTKYSDSQDCTSLNIHYVVFKNNRVPSDNPVSVMYFFMANSKIVNSREEVRNIIRNPFSKYSYFSKVEWRFYGEHNGAILSPDKNQALEASNKLISILLPILVNEHWPKTNE